MASFWEQAGISVFLSDNQQDYEVAEEAWVEEEGFVCLSPMSEDEDSETFIDEEYDICEDAIEEIVRIKREQELLEDFGVDTNVANEDVKGTNVTNDIIDDIKDEDDQTTLEHEEKVPQQAAIKRRRPEVSIDENYARSSSPIATIPVEPSTKKQKLLGEGFFGKVYKIEEEGKAYAVKELLESDPHSPKEQKMLETVSHRHIIR